MVLTTTAGSKRPPLKRFETQKLESTETTFMLHCSVTPRPIYLLWIHKANSRIISHSLWPWVRLQIGLCQISYKPTRLIVQGALVDVIGDVNILVYCDLVTPQLVGREFGRVLRTIVTPSRTGQHLFSIIYYFPVERNDFTSIHIELTLVDHARSIVF